MPNQDVSTPPGVTEFPLLIRETPLAIDGPCGPLEALCCEVPDARGVALICHPNPVQGGTMLNKVVSTLQRAVRDMGYHTLLGFSFGGFVAGALAGRLEDQGVAIPRLFMVAPAVHRLQAPEHLPQGGELVVIQPEQDEVIAPEDVYAWSARLARAHELLKVAECGHFFHGKLVELKELVQPRIQ